MVIEQRKHERTELPASVKLMHPDIGTIILKVKDMSYGGLFLLTDTPAFLPIGCIVQVQVCNPDNELPVVTMVIVRRSSEGIGLSYQQ